MKIKKNIFIIILTFLIFTFHCYHPNIATKKGIAESNTLTLQQAVQLALKNDQHYLNEERNVVAVTKKLQSAYQLAKEQFALSLITSLLSPRTDIPTELNKKMKIPMTIHELNLAKAALANKKLEIVGKVETSFIKTYKSMILKKQVKETVEKAREDLKEIKLMQQAQLATSDDVKIMEALLEEAEFKQKDTNLQYKLQLMELVSILGVEIEEGITLIYEPKTIDLAEELLPVYIDASITEDIELLKIKSERQLLEGKIKSLKRLYVEYDDSENVKQLIAMIHENQTVGDFEKFVKFYETVISQKNNRLSIYVNDEPSILPETIRALENVRRKEEHRKQEISYKVRQKFYEVKKAEESYKFSLLDVEKVINTVAEAKIKLHYKTISDEQYENEVTSLNSKQQFAIDDFFRLQEEINSFQMLVNETLRHQIKSMQFPSLLFD